MHVRRDDIRAQRTVLLAHVHYRQGGIDQSDDTFGDRFLRGSEDRDEEEGDEVKVKADPHDEV